MKLFNQWLSLLIVRKVMECEVLVVTKQQVIQYTCNYDDEIFSVRVEKPDNLYKTKTSHTLTS